MGCLRELEHCDVSIQSNWSSHQRFSDLDLGEQKKQLLKSKFVLESNLGKPVEVFSFPYRDNGVNQQEIVSVMKSIGYQAACLFGGGINPQPSADPYRLSRLAMEPDTDLRTALGQR